MYSTRPGLILAFHGCDQSIVNDILTGNTTLEQSNNKYDWLGHGIYFWDNSPSRALEYATFLKNHPGRAKSRINTPAVIGAVINLGFCLDLLDFENLNLLKLGYELLSTAAGNNMPRNKPVGTSKDLLLRELDCAVIESLHQIRKIQKLKEFDSVRGAFWEGKELYKNAGFREKDHLQICIRNPNCIKGYFLPRTLDTKFDKV
ncbi:MAG TPA: hypothetical protein VFW07_22700 [Parafilimonas sp.]|nr:hypothetical protein [Parafilimonas sp.]